jgi:hypothetical protein
VIGEASYSDAHGLSALPRIGMGVRGAFEIRRNDSDDATARSRKARTVLAGVDRMKRRREAYRACRYSPYPGLQTPVA